MHLIYIKSGRDYIYSLPYIHSTVKTTLTPRRESKRSGQNLLLPVLACKREQQRHYFFFFVAYFCCRKLQIHGNCSEHFVCDYTGKKREYTGSIPSHTRARTRDPRRPAFIAGCRKRQWDAGSGSCGLFVYLGRAARSLAEGK